MLSLLLLTHLAQAGDLVAQEQAAFQAAAAAVAPSVVRIETLGGADTAGGQLIPDGPTSGVVVDPGGLILTSSFNFAGDPSAILGRRLPAERLGEDAGRQLTLLKVAADDLIPAVPAPVGELRVGDWAVAVGRTYAAGDVNVSVGIISAKDRILGRAVQTDAKTSPANYGGALVDLSGRVVGVLAPLSPGGGRGGVEWYDSGIGFAVPLEDVLPTLNRLAAGETLKPGKLGVTFKGGDLDAAPVVDSVRPQSPAEEAGINPGDLLKALAGKPVDRPDAALAALGPKLAGDTVEAVLDRGGEEVRVTITLAAELPPWTPGFLGILPGERGDDAEPPGVPVGATLPDSPAAGTLEPGALVVAAAGEQTPTAADLRRVVSRRPPGEAVELMLAGGESMTVTLAELPGEVFEELPVVDGPAADELPEDQRGRMSIPVPGFEGRDCRAFVPRRPGRRGVAVLCVLHHPGAANAGAVLDAFAPAAENAGLIVLAPRAAGPGWSPVDLPYLKGLMEVVGDRYAPDPPRVAVLGLGDSGPVAWAVAGSMVEVVRGVVSGSDELPGRVRENEPDSPLFPLLLGAPGEEQAAALARGGYPATVVPDEPAADGAPPAADVAGAVIRWVATLDRI